MRSSAGFGRVVSVGSRDRPHLANRHWFVSSRATVLTAVLPDAAGTTNDLAV